MFSLKGGSLISLCILGVIILSSFANGQLQCPVNEVTVLDNGTILFGPLSAGSGPVDASYDPGAIGGWNSLASGFIDAVQSRPLPFDTVFSVLNSSVLNGNSGSGSTFDPLGFLQNFAAWWAGILVVTLLGILFGILFCIVGSIFWCCRCCGNCGGAKSQRARERNDCMTFTFAAVLLLCTLVLLAGAVLAFFSNEQTFRSVANIQTTLNSVVRDSSNYLEDTAREIDDLVCQFSSSQESVLQSVMGEIDGFQEELGITINNISMELTGLIRDLNNSAISELNTQVNAISSSLSAVNMTLNSITASLSAVEADLVRDINACGMVPGASATCNTLEQVRLAVNESLTQIPTLPDDSGRISEIERAISGLGGDIRAGENRITEALNSTVLDQLNSTLSEFTRIIQQANDTFIGISNSLNEFVVPLTNTSFPASSCPPLDGLQAFTRIYVPDIAFPTENSTTPTNAPPTIPSGSFQLTLGYVNECIIDASFNYISQFDVYRYAIGIVICSLALITIVLVWAGLVFGLLGFRKDRYPHDRSKASHCGGIFLLVSVGLTFLFGFFLLLLSAIFFFLGSNSLKLCQSLQGPNYDLFVHTIDNPAIKQGLQGGNVIPPIAPLLRECEENNTALYSAANLGSILTGVGLQGWAGSVEASILQLFNLTELENMVDSLVTDAASMLSMSLNQGNIADDIESALNSIPNDTLNINVTETIEMVESAVATANLNESIVSLQNISDMLSGMGLAGLAGTINDTANTLVNIRDVSLVELFMQLSQLQTIVSGLNAATDSLRQNATEIAAEITTVTARISGPVLDDFINGTVRGSIGRAFGYLYQYISHLDDQLENTVGGCQPVYGVYTQLHNTVCRNFLDGLNGFWWSLGFCSLLFIPVIVFAVITSSFFLRKKSKEEDEDGYLAYPMKSY